MSKSFRTFREQSFKLQVEGFNVFNNVRFTSPTTNVSSTRFGDYAGPTLLNSQRQLQFSGKYTF